MRGGDMSDKPILVVRATGWHESVSFAQQLFDYVFRGQANAHWELNTRMERVCWQTQFPTTFLRNREYAILRAFQRRAYHYLKSPPPLDNKLEWLALIQHYGGPTRLLDFTKSFYVAAFFAMESAKDDAAVWALKEDWLYQHTDNTIRETIYELHDRGSKIVEENLCGNCEEKIVMVAEPERLNPRISIQQGLFAIQGSLNHSFAENLQATLGVDFSELAAINKTEPVSIVKLSDIADLNCGLVKIILPLEIHNAALQDLESMNVNARTLFPGLEGFARSLNIYLRDVE
jgi:hypothetical protein